MTMAFVTTVFPDVETEAQRDLNNLTKATMLMSGRPGIQTHSLTAEFSAASSAVIHSFMHSMCNYRGHICRRTRGRMIYKTRPSLCPHGVHSPMEEMAINQVTTQTHVHMVRETRMGLWSSLGDQRKLL
jgi:hypothetical protein